MGGVVSGFATIAIVIAIGILLAQLRILDQRSELVLSRLAFFAATPALMITVLSKADVHTLFSTNLIASLAGVVVSATIQFLASTLIFRRQPGESVIAMFCSSYVNAGNLGLPLATYIIGDPSVIAPMLLAQLLVLQPAGLTVLDVINARSAGQLSRAQVVRTAVLRPIRNPMTIGSAIGVVLAVTGFRLPTIIGDPIALVGGIAVPAMLIAYGVSLRTGPLPGRGERPAQLALITVLKLVVQPAVAFAVGALALGLTGRPLLAVTMIAALPTAQNVFIFAVRYKTGTVLARDAIFLNTIISVPVIFGIAALLG